MVRQPAIAGDVWFNSKPLEPADLAGNVVLVDFWTYSCINCLRTLPYLKQWWGRYKDRRFILIGIHTPEFEFEKDPKNVEGAIKEFGVSWPVVLDNDHRNWNAFSNRYWPAKYLIDPGGRIVYTHFGEGAYAETEREIQKLIRENLGNVSLPAIEADEHAHGGVCFIPTPETYCGYLRGRLSNAGGYQEDQVAEYQPPERLPADSIALSGKFLARPEYVEAQAPGSTLLLHFHATEVNLVLRPTVGRAIAEVALDGKPLPDELRGRDVGIAGEVNIEKPAMYNLFVCSRRRTRSATTERQQTNNPELVEGSPPKADQPVEGTIGIRAVTGNFQAYAFTFSGCAPIPN